MVQPQAVGPLHLAAVYVLVWLGAYLGTYLGGAFVGESYTYFDTAGISPYPNTLYWKVRGRGPPRVERRIAGGQRRRRWLCWLRLGGAAGSGCGCQPPRRLEGTHAPTLNAPAASAALRPPTRCSRTPAPSH